MLDGLDGGRGDRLVEGEIDPGRRKLLFGGLALAAGLVLPSVPALAVPERELRLSLRHMHTGETINTVFWADGKVVPEGMREISHLLRDYQTGEITPFDPRVMLLLARLRARMGFAKAYHVVSGYRSPETNRKLREASRGVAKNSYHMRAMAIDIQVPGVRLSKLRRAAQSLRAGGVGYYPRPGFIHVDTGPVRTWG